MAINTQHELAYENINLLIQEYEEQAIRSEKREGFMAVSNGSLYRMETILDGSEDALTYMDSQRAQLTTVEAIEDEDERYARKIELMKSNVEFDADLIEAFAGEAASEYAERCFGCNLRLKFDWQLQPLEIINPFAQFLDMMNDTLDRLAERLNPWRILQDLCWAMEHLKTLCPPDLMMILMALKMLLRKYMMNMFRIQLDWSLVLGPILRAIIEGITSLLEQIKTIMLAPVQCILDALITTNALWKEIKSLGNTAKAFGQYNAGVLDRMASGNPAERQSFIGEALERVPAKGDAIARDTWWESPGAQAEDPALTGEAPPQVETQEEKKNKIFTFKDPAPDPGVMKAKERSVFEGKERPSGGIPFTGFLIKEDTTLDVAIKDPAYSKATIFEKLIVPLQDFIRWVNELVYNIISALRSLNSLVGGAIQFNLDNLGILILITDMIALIKMIWKLLSANNGVTDWCKHLQENPALVEEASRARFGADLRIEADNDSLIIRKGPDIVGKIQTCLSERSSLDQSFVDQWISDLELRGKS